MARTVAMQLAGYRHDVQRHPIQARVGCRHTDMAHLRPSRSCTYSESADGHSMNGPSSCWVRDVVVMRRGEWEGHTRSVSGLFSSYYYYCFFGATTTFVPSSLTTFQLRSVKLGGRCGDRRATYRTFSPEAAPAGHYLGYRSTAVSTNWVALVVLCLESCGSC